MSEKEKGVAIPLSKKELEFFEELAERDGLTVVQEIEVALLCFFKKYDAKLLEEAKKYVDPEVLRVFEKA